MTGILKLTGPAARKSFGVAVPNETGSAGVNGTVTIEIWIVRGQEDRWHKGDKERFRKLALEAYDKRPASLVRHESAAPYSICLPLQGSVIPTRERQFPANPAFPAIHRLTNNREDSICVLSVAVETGNCGDNRKGWCQITKRV